MTLQGGFVACTVMERRSINTSFPATSDRELDLQRSAHGTSAGDAGTIPLTDEIFGQPTVPTIPFCGLARRPTRWGMLLLETASSSWWVALPPDIGMAIRDIQEGTKVLDPAPRSSPSPSDVSSRTASPDRIDPVCQQLAGAVPLQAGHPAGGSACRRNGCHGVRRLWLARRHCGVRVNWAS